MSPTVRLVTPRPTFDGESRPVAQGTFARALDRARRALPEGRELPEDEWAARHKAILLVIWAHAIGVPIFGIYMGAPVWECLAEGGVIGLVGALLTPVRDGHFAAAR